MPVADNRVESERRSVIEDGEYRRSLAVQEANADISEYKRRSYDLLDPSKGSTVLDAGCGLGYDVCRLADRVGPAGRVVGVDASADRIRAARQRFDSHDAVRFRVGDLHDLSFDDDAFDAARADRVLQHVSDPAAALRELVRVTRSGGRLTVTDPDWHSFFVDLPEADVLDTSFGPVRNPGMGRRLFGLCRASGLTDLEVDAYTVTPRDPALLVEGAALESWTTTLVDAGGVSADRIDDLFDAIDRAADDGALFGAVTGFTVAGTVPG